jgi:hypothetical protein
VVAVACGNISSGRVTSLPRSTQWRVMAQASRRFTVVGILARVFIGFGPQHVFDLVYTSDGSEPLPQ